jgi:transposase InsO family protein
MKQSYPKVGLSTLCRLFGVTRQAYYQYEWSLSDTTIEVDVVLKLVTEIRKEQPRIGVRKLCLMIEPMLLKHQIKMGRDALFNLLSTHGMLVRKTKRRAITTISQHLFRKYENLIIDLVISRPHQLWVSDITYIPVGTSFCYLSLITDAYSHKIIGFCVSENLTARGAIVALKMALRTTNNLYGLIHHSDRGIQYCCTEYVNILKQRHIQISMTQSGDPYENAIAERVNGILKSEFLNKNYPDFDSAQKQIIKSINIYNYKRLHASCDMLTPANAHEKTGILKKHWKNYYQLKLSKKNNLNFELSLNQNV